MKTLNLALALVALSWHCAVAQQDPLYAQYINNPMVINPAFTGSRGDLTATAGYRTQWSGFDGNPTTFNFSSHISLLQNRVGLGLVVVQDKIGETKNTDFSVTYGYQIRQTDKRSFHFGLSTGMMRFQVDPSDLNLKDSNDPYFQALNESQFNVGFGALVKSDRYTVGFSVPRILPAEVSQTEGDLTIYNRHYYLYGGYVVFLNERWRFKPAALLKATTGAPLSADLNLTAVLDEQYDVGFLTRNLNTYGLLLRAKFGDYRFAYVFEVPSGNSVGQRFFSHEVSLSFSVKALPFHRGEISNF